ncbi:MAG: hypothetical protein PHF31_08110 [Methylobacter sp.]|nr:hypothetical protein [Methylobacter sp.]
MKNLLGLFAILALVSFNQVSVAEEQTPAPKTEMKMDRCTSHGQMDQATLKEHMKLEQEHQLKIHDLSNKILSETDPKKQQELKDQQLKLMEEHHMHKMEMMQKSKM